MQIILNDVIRSKYYVILRLALLSTAIIKMHLRDNNDIFCSSLIQNIIMTVYVTNFQCPERFYRQDRKGPLIM